LNKNTSDIIRLLGKNLQPLRVINGIKVISSYYLSKLIKQPIQWGYPIAFSVEPTTSCNLRCPQCPSGLRSFTRETGSLELETYKTIIDQLYRTSGYITLYFQGEPYLNKNFNAIVNYAFQKKMYTATSSNAHYFTKENAENVIKSGLDRLIISIDGIDQETYSKYRIGGSIDKVIKGTQALIEAKKNLKSKTPHIIWQFIVFRHNEHQLEDIKKMAAEVDVDELSIKTAQIYEFETGNDLIPTNENYSRYKKDENGYRFKNKLLNHCWKLWSSCVFTWNGQVVPCCFDKDAHYQLGSINSKSFKEIWQGDAYQRFRSQLIKGRKHIDICKNCSEGTSVWKN
jgi:radical SAM protein with 4Fe4S-binding SPASM domain